MTTKTKYFSSLMAGAPQSAGVAGAMIAILDAVLVNGFGLTTLTSVVVSGGLATATFPSSHSFSVDSVALISGATPSGLNGQKRVISIASNSIVFDATGISNQTATGTITCKVAPAGWAKLYTGTNLAAYKSLSVESTGCVLYVDDTGTTTARVRGYEAMTDIATGVGPFPTVSAFANPGMWWSKSDTASSAGRAWRIVADERGFFWLPQSRTTEAHQGNYFGDIIPTKPSDPYACVLNANISDKADSYGNYADDLIYSYNNPGNNTRTAWMPRAANTLGGAVQVEKYAPLPGSSPTGAAGSSAMNYAYPSPIDNGLTLCQALYHNAQGIRGQLPGLLLSPQNVYTAFITDEIILGTGAQAGKKVIAIRAGSNGNNPSASGMFFFDIVTDWR